MLAIWFHLGEPDVIGTDKDNLAALEEDKKLKDAVGGRVLPTGAGDSHRVAVHRAYVRFRFPDERFGRLGVRGPRRRSPTGLQGAPQRIPHRIVPFVTRVLVHLV